MVETKRLDQEGEELKNREMHVNIHETLKDMKGKHKQEKKVVHKLK